MGEVCEVWASRAGVGLVVTEFLDKESIFFPVGGGVYFFYKLTRNPNLTFFFWGGGGGGGGGGRRGGKGEGEGKCTCMDKCFRWHFYSSRRTPVQNYFEIHAYM